MTLGASLLTQERAPLPMLPELQPASRQERTLVQLRIGLTCSHFTTLSFATTNTIDIVHTLPSPYVIPVSLVDRNWMVRSPWATTWDVISARLSKMSAPEASVRTWWSVYDSRSMERPSGKVKTVRVPSWR